MNEKPKKDEKSIPVSRLIKIDEEQGFALGLEILGGNEGLNKQILSEEINRPGLPLAGFFDCFADKRIQVFGRGEVAFIEKLSKGDNMKNVERFFQYDIPVCIVTHGLPVPKCLIDYSNKHSIPFLRTKLTSRRFMTLLSSILSDLFAPFITTHGNFVSIYNIGVLITGKSGIGKSESVLGLVERGHKFIADDLIRVKKIRTAHGFELVGEPYMNYGPFLEIRGIGIINVAQYYGEGRILNSEKLGLIVDLHEWDSTHSYDRLGMAEKYDKILEMDVPKKEIPVSPGRNVPLLIEVAAYREIMRKMGYNAAEELNQKILDYMKSNKEVV